MYIDSVDLSFPLAWTVDDVLSPQECAPFIALMRDVPDIPAPVSTPQGPVVKVDARNNSRLIIDDEERADWVWQRVRNHVPARLFNADAVGVNERFRLYRYRSGQRFKLHRDGAFIRNDNEESRLTLIFYLSIGCVGGDTVLHEPMLATSSDKEKEILAAYGAHAINATAANPATATAPFAHPPEGGRVRPAVGRALFFQHRVVHEGAEVTSGEKLVLRTDVMYRR